MMRPRTIALPALAILVQAIGTSPALAADPVVTSFSYTGGEQSFDVPAGISSIHVVLSGGRGGAQGATTPGGRGALVEGDLAVTPTAHVYIEVGGPGADGNPQFPTIGGFNGGGNGGLGGAGTYSGSGGGASDIRTISRVDAAATLGSRLVVAGGGGGGGFSFSGGDAGQPGAGGTAGGGAGTASAGGAGGIGTSANGGAGALGIGGAAGAGLVGSSFAGGGGAGGYYGGGGGGAGLTGGGGGGGSSYTGAATNAQVTTDTAGIPSVTISYVPGGGGGSGSDTGTVDATITMASSALCLELSTSAVDFGNRQFGDADVRGTPDIDVTNCAETSATLLARGTDATGVGAAWTLVDAGTCADTLGQDAYRLALHEGVSGSTAVWQLATSNKVLLDVPAGVFAPFWPFIDTPCPGSSGAGQVMAMQIVFVVTEGS